MNTKVKKAVKIAAAALFFMALALNVNGTLNDPFVNVGEPALATDPGGGSGQKWKRKRVRCPNGQYGYGCFSGSSARCTPENCD